MKPLFTLALVALPAFAAFPNGYSYCKVVTTQHTMVSGASDLTNYPLTIVLTDADLKTTGNGGLVTNANGYDIAFYPDCSGSGTPLYWELESYTASSGALVAHVLRTALSPTVDDTIGMYYGKTGVSSFQSTASSVWNSSYKLVAHLAQSAGSNVLDSTSNANTGTPATSPAQGAAQVGGGLTFNGSTQSVGYADGASFRLTGNFTISAWMYRSASGYLMIFQDENGSTNEGGLTLGINNSNKIRLTSGKNTGVASGTDWFEQLGSTTIPVSTWTHVAGSWDGSNMHVYVNGVEDSTAGAWTNAPVYPATNYVNIGKLLQAGTNYYWWNGQLDEVRFSDTCRSADWILTEYRNQSAPGTYTSAGPRITPGAGTRVRHGVRGGG